MPSSDSWTQLTADGGTGSDGLRPARTINLLAFVLLTILAILVIWLLWPALTTVPSAAVPEPAPRPRALPTTNGPLTVVMPL